MSKYSILNPMASNFMRVARKGTTKGVRKNAKYEEGASLLALDAGGDLSAFSASRKLFPKGYDEELNALTKAFNAHSSTFRKLTVPFGMGARTEDQEGKTAARGERLVAMKYLSDGSFWAAMKSCEADIVNKKQAFRNALPGIIARIASDAKLGRTFNPLDYPEPEDIDNSFVATIEGPFPIADGRMLEGLPVEAAWVQAIEKNMEETAAAQARFAQQSIASELLHFTQVMATNLSELTRFHDGEAADRKKAPRISDSMVLNLRDIVAKARVYAIPETQEGTTLLSLADQIEETLEVDRFDSEDFKSSIPLARSTASKAASLAAAIEELPIFS